MAAKLEVENDKLKAEKEAATAYERGFDKGYARAIETFTIMHNRGAPRGPPSSARMTSLSSLSDS